MSLLYSSDGFARISSIIETKNKQQVKFGNKMREYDLSLETNVRFSSPRLDVYLCDDGVSYPLLESKLEAKFDPPLTTPSLVTPSLPSTLRDNTTFDMTLPNPPLSLAQSMKFKIGETLGVSASVGEDDTCYE